MKNTVFAFISLAFYSAFGFSPMITTNDYKFTQVYNGYQWKCENQVCNPSDPTLRMEDLVFINEAVHERWAFYYGFYIPDEPYDKRDSVSPFGGNITVSIPHLYSQEIKNSINPRAFWGDDSTIRYLSKCNHWNARYETPFYVLDECPVGLLNYTGQFFEYDYETEIANDYIGDLSPYSIITNYYVNYGVESTLTVENITNNFPSFVGREEIFNFLGKFTRLVSDTQVEFRANDSAGKVNPNFKYINYEYATGLNYVLGDFLDSEVREEGEHKYRRWFPKAPEEPYEDTDENPVVGFMTSLMGYAENSATTYQVWNFEETYDRNWNYEGNDFTKEKAAYVKCIDYRKASWDGDIYMEFGNENTSTGSLHRALYDIASATVMAVVSVEGVVYSNEGTNGVTLKYETELNYGGVVLVPVTLKVGFYEDVSHNAQPHKVFYAKTEGLDFDTVEAYGYDALGIDPIVYKDEAKAPTVYAPPEEVSSDMCGGFSDKYRRMDISVTGEILFDISGIQFDTEIVGESSGGGGGEEGGEGGGGESTPQ